MSKNKLHSRFLTIDDREGSWSTNSIQGYQSHRNAAIGNLTEALGFFKRHLDFRAFEQVEHANHNIAVMKRYEAYANETSNLLLELANHVEAHREGNDITSPGDIVAEAREAAMGKMPDEPAPPAAAKVEVTT
jgi:hypothetical protein